jgi:hypothetical protein
MKNPLPLGGKDNFNLHWFEGHLVSSKILDWHVPPQTRFTPDDILDQLACNNIRLKRRWLILDEFICF